MEQAVPKEVKALDGLDLGDWVKVVVEKNVNLEDYDTETLFPREMPGSGDHGSTTTTTTTAYTPPLIRLPGAYGIAAAGFLVLFLCVLGVVMFHACQKRRKRRSYSFADFEGELRKSDCLRLFKS